MIFNFASPNDLLTPTIIDGVVSKIDPSFASNDIFPPVDINLRSYSAQSILDNFNGTTTKQEDEDFFSSFNIFDTNDWKTSDLSMDDFQTEKYIPQSSFLSISSDMQMASFSEQSIFLPAFDSAIDFEDSSSLPWVSGECTIESVYEVDINVSLSPAVSSASNISPAPSISSSSKKSHLSTADRKLRKKDQNKTAAEKYRLKKRLQRDELLSRQTDLKHQNQELKFELEKMAFRVEQFKKLFVDVLQIPLPPSNLD